MKYGIFFLILSVLVSTNLEAKDLDSLFHKWKETSGNKRIHAGNEILEVSFSQNMLAEQRSFRRGQLLESDAHVYCMMTYYYMCKELYEEALTAGLTALPLCEKVKDNELLVGCLNNLGIIYERKGLFGQAIYYMKKVYKVNLQSKDQSGLSSTMNHLATLYLAIDQASTALSYILPAIDIEQTSGNRQELAIRLGSASDIWLKMGHPEKALSCSEEAYALDNADGREDEAARRLAQKATVLIEMGEVAEAKKCLIQAMEVLTKYKNFTSLAICNNQLGDIYYKEGMYKQSCIAYRKAIAYSDTDTARLGDVKKKALYGLGLSLKNLGQLSDALAMLEEYGKLGDKLSEDKVSSTVEDFLVMYGTREAEEALKHQVVISKRRLITMFCLIGFILLQSAVLVIFWRMLRIRRRQASILNKNSEIKGRLLSFILAMTNRHNSLEFKKIVNNANFINDVPKMTNRERDVIKLCCNGLSSKEIADKLHVSVRTIDAHKSNIFKKLNISSTVELVKIAVKTGMFKYNHSSVELSSGQLL